ncbi:MAG TPA: hypothetical protein VGE52_22230 [Pirellulales bacterium]
MPTYGDYADIGADATLEWNGNVYKIRDSAEIGGESVEKIDTTRSGVAGRRTTRMPGLVTDEDVSFTVLLDPDHPIVADLTVRDLTVNLPAKPTQEEGATWVASAFVATNPVTINVKDVMLQQITFAIAGEPNPPQWTAGSS